MKYRLRSGVSFCIANARPAFLDLAADRYFCLSGSAEEAFQALIECPSRPQVKHDDILPLIRNGLLVESDNGSLHSSWARLDPPESSALDDLTYNWNPLKVLSGLRAHMRANHALAQDSLHHIVSRIRTRKQRGLEGSQPRNPTPNDALGAFMTTRKFVASFDKCLPRSIALVDYLAEANLFPYFVMGVKMKPFAAHAWVQLNDTVLNDSVDTVTRYTPILVV